MRKFIVLYFFILISFNLFSQSKKDIRKYDMILDLIDNQQLNLAKSETLKLLDKNNSWKQPYVLLGSIYKKEGDIERSADAFLKFYDFYDLNHSQAIFEISRMLFNAGLYDKALFSFRSLDNIFKSMGIYNAMSEDISFYISNCLFAIESKKNPYVFDIYNLGENINSNMAEYSPFISSDGNHLIITRNVELDTNFSQEDFYISYKDTSGRWSYAVPLDIGVNTMKNEGAISFSADGKYLVYSSCYREDGLGSCDLYLCIRQSNGEWSSSMNLGILNTKYWETQPCFSPDGNYLYFISNRPGGVGGDDVWRSRVNRFGFSSPENLGKVINTKNNERSPFLHPDNLTFYFSSNGHLGMGGYDIYLSRRENSLVEWGVVENLGYPINSFGVENSLTVHNNGVTAFFVSDKSGSGKEDIFYFELPQEKRAHSLSYLEIDIISVEEGGEVILNNVLFETDSYFLLESSYQELDLLISYLNNHPQVNIHIEGHTDNIGTEESNQILSEKRAVSVYNYLISKDIPSSRLTFKGYGESRPIDDNELESGRASNRRTSFVISR